MNNTNQARVWYRSVYHNQILKYILFTYTLTYIVSKSWHNEISLLGSMYVIRKSEMTQQFSIQHRHHQYRQQNCNTKWNCQCTEVTIYHFIYSHIKCHSNKLINLEYFEICVQSFNSKSSLENKFNWWFLSYVTG